MAKKDSILLELQYLPPIQYFTKFLQYEEVIIEQYEHYCKGSYRNRCHIAGVNGMLRLSVPLIKGKNEQQNIREVKIAYQEPWLSQQWTSIRSAYGNAPFFDFYAPYIEPFFKGTKPEYLFPFNKGLLECILQLLQLDTSVNYTKEYVKELPEQVVDFRNAIHPKGKQRKVDEKFYPLPYSQVFMEKTGFLPNLSILDLLFCTGPEAILLLEQMGNTTN